MKLYDGGRAPNPRRTRIFLAEKGIKLPLVEVDLGALEHMSTDYAAINPVKRVPALVLDDGTVSRLEEDVFRLTSADPNFRWLQDNGSGLEAQIEELMENGLEDGLAKPRKIGRAKRIDDAQARYIEFAKRTFPKNLRLDGLRVVVDCAHGAAYKVAPAILWELGAEVIAIGDEPNGLNINDECGSTSPEQMQRKVRERRADFGIALDGDADRVVMSDEEGNLIDGDQILGLIARSWSRQGKLKGHGVVGTVMSNVGLERYLQSLDLKLARAAVGDRYVIEIMNKDGYNVGGEQSGHIVLNDFSTTGDGLIAALQVLAVLAEGNTRASEAAHIFEPLPQVLENVRFRNGSPLSDARVTERIKACEARLNGAGRVLVRKSGTEPVIRVMAEGDDEALVRSIVHDLVSVIEEVAA